MDEKPKYPVQTVGKAIEIINFLAKDSGNRGIGITELSREIGLGKSTVHRILDTLLYYGYIDKNWETSRYRLGWKLHELGQRVPQQNQIFNLDSSYLVELNRKVGETVNLGVLNRKETVLISKIESNHSGVRIDIQAGEREAVHATALGKVLISGMSDEAVRDLLRDTPVFHRYTENTITTVEELLEEIHNIRDCGYAVDNQEFAIGLICVACPVRDYTGNIIASVSVSAPSSRMGEERRKKIVNTIQGSCARISWNLGYQPTDVDKSGL